MGASSGRDTPFVSAKAVPIRRASLPPLGLPFGDLNHFLKVALFRRDFGVTGAWLGLGLGLGEAVSAKNVRRAGRAGLGLNPVSICCLRMGLMVVGIVCVS